MMDAPIQLMVPAWLMFALAVFGYCVGFVVGRLTPRG